MKLRMNYNGGGRQQGRMIQDKLRSLKKALLYSYQAATAILSDGREFRCLMNPDKLKTDYEDKIISIPFEDICIGKVVDATDDDGNAIRVETPAPAPTQKTSKGLETIGLKVGDVFEWKETSSYWLVYLQYLEELAYFRAECRRCDHELLINGKRYRAYMHGPQENTIDWHQKHKITWNDVDWHMSLYIVKNDETDDFFTRFKKFTIDNRPYEVQVVDRVSNPGLLTVRLQEAFTNSIADEIGTDSISIVKIKDYIPISEYSSYNSLDVEIEDGTQEIEEGSTEPIIIGNRLVYPYDRVTYTVENISMGTWEVDNNKKVRILQQTDEMVILEILTGKSGKFTLKYVTSGNDDLTADITIGSL